jgi:hypothetical protein
MKRMLRGLQNWSGPLVKKESLAPGGNRTPKSPTRSLVTVTTELPIPFPWSAEY